MAKLYAVIDEYKGGYVGTVDAILEWLEENNCGYGEQKFYEVGQQVQLEIKLPE